MPSPGLLGSSGAHGQVALRKGLSQGRVFEPEGQSWQSSGCSYVGEAGSGQGWAGRGHCCECLVPSRRFAGGKYPAWEGGSSAALGGTRHPAPPVPGAPGWAGVGPGPGRAGASAKPAPEREHGCHLPTTPSPLQTPSPKDAFRMLWPLCLLRGLPGWHRALAHPWDSSGGPCPGTAPCRPWPRFSVSLARAAGALSGLRQRRGTGPVVRDGTDCREDGWSLSQDLAQRSATRSVPMRGCLPFQSLLPAL